GQLVVGQAPLGAEESEVDGLRAELGESARQLGAVVGPDGAQVDRGAVAQDDVGGVVPPRAGHRSPDHRGLSRPGHHAPDGTLPVPSASVRGRERDRMWYFAYGSNMQSDTLHGRRGIAFRRAVAVRAPGWRVVFDKPPLLPIGEAFANIVPDPDA